LNVHVNHLLLALHLWQSIHRIIHDTCHISSVALLLTFVVHLVKFDFPVSEGIWNIVAHFTHISESIIAQDGVFARTVDTECLGRAFGVFFELEIVMLDFKLILNLSQVTPRMVHHRVKVSEPVK
jgi:hypothetical protein